MALDQSPFLADPALLEALEGLSVPIDCREDRVLFRQDESCTGLYILRRGHAGLEMNSYIGEVVARFSASDDSLLGLPAALSGDSYSLTAVARKGSIVCFVGRNDFLALMTSNADLSLKALQIMAAETRAARFALVDLLSRQELP